MEKPSPASGTGLLNRRDGSVFCPVVIRGGQENRGMFESGRKKRPHEDLFIADEHGGVMIVDANGSAGKEIQWHAVITKRFPHGNRNGNALLIESGIFLSSREQHIQVVILRKRISRSVGWVDSSSDKDRA